MMRILLLGAGAVGGYFIGHLVRAGEACCDVVVRRDAEKIRSCGYTVEAMSGTFSWRPEQVFSSSEAAAQFPYDAVVLTSKVLPEIDFCAMLRPVLPPGRPLVLIQNGIDIERPLAEAFPKNEIASFVAYIGAARTATGVIHQQGSARLIGGSWPCGKSEFLESLCHAFERSGVPCRISEQIGRDRFEKLLWNLAFNPVSVLAGGANTARMSSDAKLAALCRALMEEVAALAQAEGCSGLAERIEPQMQFTRDFPPYKPSMLLDYEAHRPMEVGAILGNAVAMAEKRGLALPHMKTCYALLSAVDAANRESRQA
ncbi:MAG: 2-dehydropantoate 2-reductase [Victivallaceae bacterium]|nr:2-dehydropantoate 2-reductase [Victivallaceae bacterium]